jgi:hypothetical protein
MEDRYDNTGCLPLMHKVVSPSSPKILSLDKFIATNFHLNTMGRELEGNLEKYRNGDSEMLKADVGVDP